METKNKIRIIIFKKLLLKVVPFYVFKTGTFKSSGDHWSFAVLPEQTRKTFFCFTRINLNFASKAYKEAKLVQRISVF